MYRLADDSLLLRFEDVDIGSGPALEVYLVPGADQRGLGGGHHEASLTAERGNQNYTVPAGVDLSTGVDRAGVVQHLRRRDREHDGHRLTTANSNPRAACHRVRG
ncbi:MAG: hypothetical protein R2695_01060 [Acidimicrobiales bacterium]